MCWCFFLSDMMCLRWGFFTAFLQMDVEWRKTALLISVIWRLTSAKHFYVNKIPGIVFIELSLYATHCFKLACCNCWWIFHTVPVFHFLLWPCCDISSFYLCVKILVQHVADNSVGLMVDTWLLFRRSCTQFRHSPKPKFLFYFLDMNIRPHQMQIFLPLDSLNDFRVYVLYLFCILFES